jgi:hypothetical protein
MFDTSMNIGLVTLYGWTEPWISQPSWVSEDARRSMFFQTGVSGLSQTRRAKLRVVSAE